MDLTAAQWKRLGPLLPKPRRRPTRIIGDRGYDSDALDAQLAKRGIEFIAPHRSTGRYITQDGRPLRRYCRRWKIERLFAWLELNSR